MKSNVRYLSVVLVAAMAFCLLIVAKGHEFKVANGTFSVKMKESGKPFPKAKITLTSTTVKQDDPDEPLRTIKLVTDDRGQANATLPAGQYAVTVSGKAHREEGLVLSFDEGQNAVTEISAKPDEESLEIYNNQQVYTPDEVPHIRVQGFLKDPKLTLKVFKLDAEKLAQTGRATSYLNSSSFNPDQGLLVNPVREETYLPKNIDAEGVFNDKIDLTGLKPGLYVCSVSGGIRTHQTFLNITHVGLVSVSGSNKSLFYTMDLVKGTPIQGARLIAYGAEKGQSDDGDSDQTGGKKIVEQATTGRDGLATMSKRQSSVIARYGEEIALVGVSQNYDNESLRMAFSTDRPVYRPGDTVQFRGVLRKIVDGSLKLPSKGEATVQIYDPANNLLESKQVAINQHGVFSGQFVSNPEAMPGSYRLNLITKDGQKEDHFGIAAYRKPEFKVEVVPDKQPRYRGDDITGVVQARYYFGAPLPGAKVMINVSRHRHWGYQAETESDDEESDADHSYGSPYYSTQLEGVTDEQGNYRFSVSTKDQPSEDDGDSALPIGYDADYQVDAYVTPISGREVNSAATVLVKQGSISLSSDGWLFGEVKKATDCHVTVTDSDGKPAAGLQVNLQQFSLRYSSRRMKREPIPGSTSATTNADGVVTFPITSDEPGSRLLVFSATDSMGHKVNETAEAYFEESGYVQTEEPTAGTLNVILDKRIYKPGESATLAITTDNPGGDAVLVIGADRLVSYKPLHLAGKVTKVNLPIQDSYAPNTAVTVVYVRNKQLMQDSGAIRLSSSSHDLKVTLTPDKQSVQPGDTVRYAVKTQDSAGHGVPAQLSLGVVDESVYAVEPDTRSIKRDFYPRVFNRLEVNYSFEEVYLDSGDKGEANVTVRKNFKDTAFWTPDVETDRNGNASVAVRLPDNLGQWRATAVAVTDDTKVGQQKVVITAAKDLMARVETGQVSVEGDEQQVTVTLTNATATDMVANVRVQAEGVQLTGFDNRQMTIKAHSDTPIVGSAKILSGVAQGVITVKAWTSAGPNDGVEQKVKIKPYGRDVRVAGGGSFVGDGSESFTLPDGMASSGRGLTIRLLPSVRASLAQAYRGLVQYPYGCVEQTTSTMLGTLLVTKLAESSGADLGKDLPNKEKAFDTGFHRLQRMQKSDGSFGWWEVDEPDMGMTGYVLHAMAVFRDQGIEPRYIIIQNAERAAAKMLVAPKGEYEHLIDRLTLAEGLAHWDQESVKKWLATVDLSKEGAAELGMGVLAGRASGYDSAKVAGWLKALKGRLFKQGQLAYWKPEGWLWGDHTTAIAFLALAASEPNAPEIKAIESYLLAAQRGDFWGDTWTTAYVIEAITKAQPAGTPWTGTQSVAVSVNGKSVGTLSVKPDEMLISNLEIHIPVSALRAGKNSIQLKTGAGIAMNYSYTADVVDSKSDLSKPAPAKGLTVWREYKRMVPRRNAQGEYELSEEATALTSAKQGETLRCILHVKGDAQRDFVMIEDPIPANLRVTERQLSQMDMYDERWMPYSMSLYDDRVNFFVRTLNAEQTFKYVVQVESTGTCTALPPSVRIMYDPDVYASGPETRFSASR
ncbi:MAG: hypothetical protein JSS72_00135 [Armatimonadetes bacterium]|nr:hypothetical protein [Armatimonadota bacterium]